MDEKKIKEELRGAARQLITGVKMMVAATEVEYPGKGHLAMDVFFEEADTLRKFRSVTVNTALAEAKEPVQKPTNELMETVPLMASEDYKERFLAEYRQTKIRYDKLHQMLVKYDAGTLDFTPTCPVNLLREQKAAMGKYLNCLEVRAQIEGVTL